MHTILRIDLKSHAQFFALIFHVLVHARGTEAILDALICGKVGLSVSIPVFDLEMTGLIFFVIGARSRDGGEDVEGDFVVGFRICDFLAGSCGFGGGMVWFSVFESPGSFAAEDESLEAGVEDSPVET